MWLPILLITLAFTNVIADVESDLLECAKQAGIEDMQNIDANSLPQDLDGVCPLMLGFFNCIEGIVLQYTGLTVQQLGSALQGTDAARGITVYTNVRLTFEELCDSDSQLHKDYKESEKCFDEVSSEGDEWCKQEAEETYALVRTLENEVQEAAGENPSEDNRACMVASYRAACAGVDILEKCGQKAFDTYRQIVKKTSLFKHGVCTEDQLLSAKDKLLDGLELSGPERELYGIAFDLKKKRRK